MTLNDQEHGRCLEDLADHIRDLRTALVGLCYAMGRQPHIDPNQFCLDLLEICLHGEGPPIATELMTLLAQSIRRGQADAREPGAGPANEP